MLPSLLVLHSSTVVAGRIVSPYSEKERAVHGPGAGGVGLDFGQKRPCSLQDEQVKRWEQRGAWGHAGGWEHAMNPSEAILFARRIPKKGGQTTGVIGRRT